MEINEEDAAMWIVKAIGRRQPEAFVSAVHKLGFPLHSKKMEPELVAAMMSYAAINYTQLRKILQYCTYHLKAKLFCSEREIRKLSCYDLMPPESGFARIGNKKITYWLKPVDKVLCHYTDLCLLDNPTFKFTSVDVVFGGDHGKRKFWMIIKVKYRNEDRTLAKETRLKVGQIDCKKDTALALLNTFGPTLNKSSNRIIVGGSNLLSIFRLENAPAAAGAPESMLYALFGGKDAGNNQEGRTLLYTVPVRLYMTGDLAFYSTILGRENMSGAWCYVCSLSHQAFQPLEYTEGYKWTFDKLELHLEKLNDGTLNKKVPQEVRGVTAKAIFDAVPLENWIDLVLHIFIGIGNGLLKFFLDFVNTRIENVPASLCKLQTKVTELQVELEDYVEGDYEVWIHEGGAEILLR